MINEEEFFDAVDASLDKLESEADSQFERNREITRNIIRHTPTANTPGSVLTLPADHRLHEEVGGYFHSDTKVQQWWHRVMTVFHHGNQLLIT